MASQLSFSTTKNVANDLPAKTDAKYGYILIKHMEYQAFSTAK
jgi:hypothetical protein